MPWHKFNVCLKCKARELLQYFDQKLLTISTTTPIATIVVDGKSPRVLLVSGSSLNLSSKSNPSSCLSNPTNCGQYLPSSSPSRNHPQKHDASIKTFEQPLYPHQPPSSQTPKPSSPSSAVTSVNTRPKSPPGKLFSLSPPRSSKIWESTHLEHEDISYAGVKSSGRASLESEAISSMWKMVRLNYVW